MSIAQTILAQLGGSKFIAMTGAKNLVSGADSLQFSIGRNASRANKVRVTLTSDDLYTVEFFRLRGIECDMVCMNRSLNVEQLRAYVSTVTGFALSL
jgi:hypothetical protein